LKNIGRANLALSRPHMKKFANILTLKGTATLRLAPPGIEPKDPSTICALLTGAGISFSSYTGRFTLTIKHKKIMNKVMFFTLIFLAVAGRSIAQDGHRHVPASVQNSFQKDYPEARNPQWSSANGHWSASFTDNSQYDRGEMVAHYDRYGSHVDSHIPYDRDDVPQAVVERTERSYPGAKEYNYTRIERPAGQPLFQVNLRVHGKNRMMYIDDNGRQRQYYDHH
jgi:hypothetical protein